MGLAEPVRAAVRRVRGRSPRARRAVQQSARARPRHTRLDRHDRRGAFSGGLYDTAARVRIYSVLRVIAAAADRQARQRKGQRVLGGPQARQRQAAFERLAVRNCLTRITVSSTRCRSLQLEWCQLR